MYLLRSVALEDIPSIFQLSQLVYFINLPANLDYIEKLVQKSVKCFASPSKKFEDNFYLFVIEDMKHRRVVGCSLIHAQHGTTKEPHFYLRVDQEHKFSKAINTGFVHGTLKLGWETNGPTEIGALLIHPEFRANGLKLGKQISFIRFLYMALHAERFKNTIHAELMPPLDDEGNSPLWEAIGRKFFNMDYQEADLLSKKNKEFILSLFPSNLIYQALLPTEARLAIGKVGADTEPVKKMLEEIGFEYTQEVDPFDGGPHYRAELGHIKPVKEKIMGTIVRGSSLHSNSSPTHLLHLPGVGHYQFCAVATHVEYQQEALLVPAKLLEEFPEIEGKLGTAIGL
jgi:arginine N-succinyltransferase